MVGWNKRSDIDIALFLKLLQKFNCDSVLDVAMGTGFHSINFLQDGYSVTGIDKSQAMIDVAKKNALKYRVKLNTICTDWTDLRNKTLKQHDCIICLGNSLACENDPKKRQLAIHNWSEVLSDNGIIIIDRRNYEAILKKKNFINTRQQYCGESVTISPEKIAKDETVFSYTFLDGQSFKLQMFPILDDYIKSIFAKAGFTPIEIYGDHKLTFDKNTVEFYHYVFKRTKYE